MCSTNAPLPRIKSDRGVGLGSTLLAAVRSSFRADRQRAKTASPGEEGKFKTNQCQLNGKLKVNLPIKVTGMPVSSADIAVHLPVPFLNNRGGIQFTILTL